MGCGSVGLRHALSLQARADELVLVEQSEDVAVDLAAKFPKARIVRHVEDVGLPVADCASGAAVVSTWGPSHYEVFCKLVEAGFKRILIEKPMTASIETGASIVAMQKEHELRLVVHQRWRYLDLVGALRKIAVEFELGNPVAAHVSGGAICLATAGVHWIDLTHQLFSATPISVVSTAKSEPLNPRSPELGFYGGTAVWTFPAGQEAVFSFSNRSSLAPQITIYYRDGTVEFPFSLDMTVKHRSKSAVLAQPKITRYGLPTEVHHIGQRLDPNVDTVDLCLDDLLGEGTPRSSVCFGFDAIQSLIGALDAGNTGQRVMLPLETNGSRRSVEWPIS